MILQASALALVIVALSGAAYAHAQIPSGHVGDGLYITNPASSITTACLAGTYTIGSFTTTLDADGLQVDYNTLHASTVDPIKDIGYIQVRAISTGKVLNIYNFVFTNTGETHSFKVPTAALAVISNDVATEAFDISPVHTKLAISDEYADAENPANTRSKAVTINGITLAKYSTFSSFTQGSSVVLNDGNNDIFVKHFANGTKEVVTATKGTAEGVCVYGINLHDTTAPTFPASMGLLETILSGGTYTPPTADLATIGCVDNSGNDPVVTLETDVAGLLSTPGTHNIDYKCRDQSSNEATQTHGTFQVLALLPDVIDSTTRLTHSADACNDARAVGTSIVDTTVTGNSMAVTVQLTDTSNTIQDGVSSNNAITFFQVYGDVAGKNLRVYDFTRETVGGIKFAKFTIPDITQITSDVASDDPAIAPVVSAVVTSTSLSASGSSANIRIIYEQSITHLHYLTFDTYLTDTLPTLLQATGTDTATADGSIVSSSGDWLTGTGYLGELGDLTHSIGSPYPPVTCVQFTEPAGHIIAPVIVVTDPDFSFTLTATAETPSDTDWEGPGAVCTDNIDDDKPATASIKSGATNVKAAIVITYTCTDSHGNPATIDRDTRVDDKTPPVVAAKTGAGATDKHTDDTDLAVGINLNDAYTEFGFTCADNDDASPTRLTVITLAAPPRTPTDSTVTAVDPEVPGVYSVVFTCTDDANNAKTITKTVTVTDSQPPTIELNQYRGVTVTTQDVVIGHDYKEIGATCRDNYKTLDGTAATVAISTGTVDTSQASATDIIATYSCDDGTELVTDTTNTRTIRVIADVTPPDVEINSPMKTTFQIPDDPYSEVGARCLDPIDTTTERIDDEVDATDPEDDGRLPLTSDTRPTFHHNHLEEIDGLTLDATDGRAIAYLGDTTRTYTCTDAVGNSAEGTHTITGISDQGIAILNNDYLRVDVPLGEERANAGWTDLELQVGEVYDEPGALCLFQYNGAKNVTLGGDRVITTEVGEYAVEYTCTDNMDDMNPGMVYTALPAQRPVTVVVRTIDSADLTVGFEPTLTHTPRGSSEGEEINLVDTETAFIPITHVAGSPFDSNQVVCTSKVNQDSDTGEFVVVPSVITAILFSLTFVAPEDRVPYPETLPEVGMLVDEFIQGASPGLYEVEYACTEDTSLGIYGRVGALRITVFAPSGSSDDWVLNPTFGMSWDSGALIVEDGFSFNGRTFDVTDNYHVDFERTTSTVGDTNTVTLKTYSEMTLDTVSLSLGIPELSRVSDSEADIHVKLQASYEDGLMYDIIDIIHEQDEPLVDPDHTTATIRQVACNSSSEIVCYEFEIKFRIMAPLMSDVLAISVMDIDRRITTTYINDGVEFEGESLLSPDTATLYFKRGNQHPVETVHLTQEDRRYNLWSDQHGYVWIKNTYGSWYQLTQAGFEKLQDNHANVMTRTHSSFADIISQEREKAKLIFDAESIISQVGESFSHAAPVRIDKLDNPVILEKLRVAELAALEYLKSYD